MDSNTADDDSGNGIWTQERLAKVSTDFITACKEIVGFTQCKIKKESLF